MRAQKLFLGGVTAHLHFIKKSVKEGIENFYIVSVSALKSYARELAEKSLRDCRLQQMWEDEYTATFRKRKTKLYCAMLSKI